MPSASAARALPGAASPRSPPSAVAGLDAARADAAPQARSAASYGRRTRQSARRAARAIYLGASLYRIHGSNEPDTIGQAVSSGCIRLTNEDVIDLYNRVPIGATVIV